MTRLRLSFVFTMLLASCAVYAGSSKVSICHYPPGNLDNPQTITVGEKALKAHLQHGDSVGPCPTGCQLDGDLCDDGDLCTFDDCRPDGSCAHNPINCDDGNVCTSDVCEPAVGCVYPPDDGVACDDGNACTGGDTCTDTVCAGQNIPDCCLVDMDCEDGDVCTVDTCDDYSCANTPQDCSVPNDHCVVGFCDPAEEGDCATTPVNCDDGNVCTDDLCDSTVTGCYSVPTSNPPQDTETSCDDGADNDCDGDVDLDDPDCIVSCDEEPVLVNGGFESHYVGAGNIVLFQTGFFAGWTAEWVNPQDKLGLSFFELYNAVGAWTAYSGDNFLELDSDFSGTTGANLQIDQSFAVIDGAAYTVSFAWSPRPDTAVNEMEFLVDGVVVGSYSGSGTGAMQWSLETYTFVASGTSANIGFREVGPEDFQGMFLDAVSVACAE